MLGSEIIFLSRPGARGMEEVNEKMHMFLKWMWIVAIAVVSLSLVWFLLGSTALFQRDIDLVTTFVFVQVWAPALILTGLSILLLKRGWMPSNIFMQIGLGLAIIILTSIFTGTLFLNVDTKGWLTEKVRSDDAQITSDGKYEYRLELINLFQRNSYARLCVKDMFTGSGMIIPIDIRIREMNAIIISPDEITHWIQMKPSDIVEIYTLTTTEELGINRPVEKFEVDMKAKTSQRIE